MKLVLASASPRRKHLLQTHKIPCVIIPSHISEPPPGFMKAAPYARKLALAKARVVAKQFKEGLVLGADTVVVHKGEILGKPADLADGYRMLGKLQGTTHKVVTGVALVDAATGKEKVAHAVSTVTMRPLSPAEIFRLAKKNLDKAGATPRKKRRTRWSGKWWAATQTW